MAENRGERVIESGMGGAGGGDLDDMGDDGFPEGVPSTEEIANRIPGDELDQRLHDALQMVAGQGGGDVETARTMGSGDTDTSPGLPAGNLNVDDIRSAQHAARDGIGGGGTASGADLGADSDVGAPWDKVGDAARLGENPKPRP